MTFTKTNGKNTIKRDFKNEGEHSEYLYRKAFDKSHIRKTFPKYTGQIKIDTSNNKTTISFDTITINVFSEDSNLIDLFKFSYYAHVWGKF